jgi:hypothetical protein
MQLPKCPITNKLRLHEDLESHIYLMLGETRLYSCSFQLCDLIWQRMSATERLGPG